MPARGRNTDVSPITLDAAVYAHELEAQLSLHFLAPSNPANKFPPCSHPAMPPVPQHPSRSPSPMHNVDSAQAVYPIPAHHVASSSRLEPCPPFSCSQSSTSSTSSDITPAPLTPPTVTNDLWPARYTIPPFDYYESPPSPPRTLQDQMQVAYAHDNMHLAKILLLKLKGIEVTDDKDPRIDQVKDEDFSSAFVPRGGLVLGAEQERQCREAEKRARELQRRRAREDRLRACEQIWENSSRALQAEKVKVTRRKEAAACVRRRLDMEVRGRVRAQERDKEGASRAVRTVRYSSGIHRPVLSFDHLSASSRRAKAATSNLPPMSAYNGPLFEYPFIPAPAARISPPAYQSTKSTADGPYRVLSTLANRSIPFADVVASMDGALFPAEDDGELSKKAESTKELELLKTLLQSVTWDDREEQVPRRTITSDKGKARAGVPDHNCSIIRASVSTSSLTTSLAISLSSSIRRSTSWFSFGSRVSVSTAATSPPASPAMSYDKSFQLAASTSRDCLKPAARRARSPRTPRTLSTSVAPSETPLGDLRPRARSFSHLPKSADDDTYTRGRMLNRRTSFDASSHSSSTTSTAATVSIVARVSRSVSTFVDMAAQFQRAYVRATMYTANPDVYFQSSPYPRSRSRSRSRSRARSSTPRSRMRTSAPRPEGYRACSEDVEVFTSVDACAAPVPERALIPLAYTRAPCTSPPEAPRVFPPPPPIPRSPFRLPHPPTELTSRYRPVANPLLLRMRALQNLCRPEAAQVLEVREKVVGIAWEGIGHSGLIREVKPCCG
ncbi:uncharacterized protein PHACADRAFT_248094 [Phanerochaete carnosa HHB-10118-sp]|uniref:Uncharacterized protein n=1 Tax=Phanerochaete carnosa (strain HHB-10118-sp) TaxID=650164 RepID=K5WPS3_PHACS|nr:uncharacterized protein PHACADRAFT_248094 [Phanerochaete carnosa HHB-10118-sp]EKM61465.1 hypothetical protein PHACADRAFT_248094 [Phanerochaete carnosa HHB-10118-sp]